MLTRVQRELSTVHSLSLYKKQNSFAAFNSDKNSPNVEIANDSNGYSSNNEDANQSSIGSNSEANRMIHQILQEVNEKREIRERRQSDEESGSNLEIAVIINPKTKYYKLKYKIYSFLNSPVGFWATRFVINFNGLLIINHSNCYSFH
jgi:hypothetical protein